MMGEHAVRFVRDHMVASPLYPQSVATIEQPQGVEVQSGQYCAVESGRTRRPTRWVVGSWVNAEP